MNSQPKKQYYDSCKKNASVDVDLGFVVLRKGTFIHVNANGEAVEIRMDDDGTVGVCVSKGVAVATFAEIYGDA